VRELTLRTADHALIAVLATCCGLFLVAALWLLPHGANNYADQELTLDWAFAHMRALAGPDAVDCGQVALLDNAEPAVQCMEAALRDEQPFWIARENSFDRQIKMELRWYGFIRQRNKAPVMATYMPPNTVAAEGYFKVHDCSEIRSRLKTGLPGPTCVQVYQGKRYEWPHFWFGDSPREEAERRKRASMPAR
jgi:hypothetical protein